MALRLLIRLGLRFEDPAMEKADHEYKIKKEDKIFVAFSLLCTTAALGQLLVDYAVGLGFVLINGLIAAGAIVALLIRNKVTWLYRFYFMMYIPINNYTTINNTINVAVPYTAGYTLLVGNYLGIIEVLFLMIFKQSWVRVILACLLFATKLGALGKNLSIDDTFAWTCVIFLILTTMNVYNETVERKIFRTIYESRQALEKFQALLSNDFPSNVLIVDNNFTSILYSNQSVSQKFDLTRIDDKKEWISLVFKQFHLEAVVKPLLYQDLLNKGDTLLDFARKLPLCPPNMQSMQSDEVIVLSATYGINEESQQNFEIRLRKILWERKSCYTVILNDFSDRQLVAALKYADEQKDRVIATVSHELRTPINGILGLLEMTEPYVADYTAQTYLQHCKSCSKLLLYLVNSILDLSQIRHNKLHIVKDNFNLDELLEEMKSLYKFQCQQKGVELIIQRGLCVPEFVYNDKYRVIEILINLLSNAFKFTFKGSITLSVMKDHANSKKIKFSVQDTGLGIKEEDKPKLFRMFGKIAQQNKNVNSHGAGLGLTISNSLVRVLNDNEEESIELESEYQKGSLFSFRIPFKKSARDLYLAITSQEDASQSDPEDTIDFQEFYTGEGPISTKMETMTNRGLLGSPTHHSEERYHNRSPALSNFLSPMSPKNLPRKVLVVDDNPFNLLTASFLLEKNGLTVEKATSGEHCIDLLQKSFGENNYYDLVFMDIQMPIQDGIETTKIIVSKVRAGELYDVPIVALTANKVMAQELHVYKESGMREALEKPLREDTLQRVLTTYIMSEERIQTQK